MIRNKIKEGHFHADLMLFAFFLMIVAAAFAPVSASAADPFAGNIRVIEKESPVLRVRVLRGGQTDGPSAKTGDAVFQGDTIRTDEGVRIQVALTDGSNIFIGPGSTVQMKNFFVNPAKGARSMTVKALKGTFRFLVAKLFKNKASGSATPWADSGVTVETHTAIAGVKGTDFAVTIGESDVEIAVFEGMVSVKNSAASVAGEIMLGASQVSRVMRGAVPSTPQVMTPQTRDKLLRKTTPAKVMTSGAKATTGPKKGKAKGELGIAGDLAQGVPLTEIVNEAVKDGISIEAVVAEALAAGVDPAYVVFTAVSEGYNAQIVVSAALAAGVPLDSVVNAAIVGGADNAAVYVGAADAGAPPAAVANEISIASSPGSPVFGASSPANATPTAVQPGDSTPPAPLTVSGGGGATPSTQPASPYKP